MRTKKLLFTTAVIIAAIIIMAAYAAFSYIAEAPVITEKEFPFSITYELNGKTETMEGIYAVTFTGHGGYIDSTQRMYEGKVLNQNEDDGTAYILSKGKNGTIMLYTNLQADYLMGDPYYDYFPGDTFKPVLSYHDPEGNSYEDEKTISEHGAKLISWEYPEPVENSFVFSHISYMTGEVVIPTVIIAAAALLLIVIFAKKEKRYRKDPLDKASVIFNFAIALVALPFMTIYGMFSDINGSSPGLLHQMGYVAPAITILGLAASVGLRRKGLSKASFIAQFAGVAFFAVLAAIVLISELF